MAWPPGKSANPDGARIKDYRARLYAALKRVQVEKGMDFFEHCVREAYTDPLMAREILRKFVPDMRELHLQADGMGDAVRSLFAGIYDAVRGGAHPPERPALPDPQAPPVELPDSVVDVMWDESEADDGK